MANGAQRIQALQEGGYSPEQIATWAMGIREKLRDGGYAPEEILGGYLLEGPALYELTAGAGELRRDWAHWAAGPVHVRRKLGDGERLRDLLRRHAAARALLAHPLLSLESRWLRPVLLLQVGKEAVFLKAVTF